MTMEIPKTILSFHYNTEAWGSTLNTCCLADTLSSQTNSLSVLQKNPEWNTQSKIHS